MLDYFGLHLFMNLIAKRLEIIKTLFNIHNEYAILLVYYVFLPFGKIAL
jgi:hypothetical protein